MNADPTDRADLTEVRFEHSSRKFFLAITLHALVLCVGALWVVNSDSALTLAISLGVVLLPIPSALRRAHVYRSGYLILLDGRGLSCPLVPSPIPLSRVADLRLTTFLAAPSAYTAYFLTVNVEPVYLRDLAPWRRLANPCIRRGRVELPLALLRKQPASVKVAADFFRAGASVRSEARHRPEGYWCSARGFTPRRRVGPRASRGRCRLRHEL